MNRWFDILTETLKSEGVLDSPVKKLLVPEQFYASHVFELGHQVVRALKTCMPQAKGLCIFVDGNSKLTSESTLDLDSLFERTLTELGVVNKWVNASELLKLEPQDLHASFDNLPSLRETVGAYAGYAFVVLGSGTLTDLVKHALCLEKRPEAFFVIPTALTVTAFTSAFAVLEHAGAKRTQMSRTVSATFWLESLLSAAPMALSRAGYGDLLARFVAYTDWYLGFHLGIMDSYDELAFRLMEPFSEALKSGASGFGGDSLSPVAVQSCAAALSMAGIAMSVSGQTTPLSGFEHVISHALDYLRMTARRDLVLHGEQVSLGCLTSASTLGWLLNQKEFDEKKFRYCSDTQIENLVSDMIRSAPYFPAGVSTWHKGSAELAIAWEEQLHSATQTFAGEAKKKNALWHAFRPNLKAFLANWEDTKPALKRLSISEGEMETLLTQAGLPLSPEALQPSTSSEEYRWAVRFSPFIRARMSVSDFVFWIGEDPAVVAAI